MGSGLEVEGRSGLGDGMGINRLCLGCSLRSDPKVADDARTSFLPLLPILAVMMRHKARGRVCCCS